MGYRKGVSDHRRHQPGHVRVRVERVAAGHRAATPEGRPWKACPYVLSLRRRPRRRPHHSRTFSRWMNRRTLAERPDSSAATTLFRPRRKRIMLHGMPTNTRPDTVHQAALRVLRVDEKIQAVEELRRAGDARDKAHEQARESDRVYSTVYARACKIGWDAVQLKELGFEPAPQRPRGRPRGRTSKSRGAAERPAASSGPIPSLAAGSEPASTRPGPRPQPEGPERPDGPTGKQGHTASRS